MVGSHGQHTISPSPKVSKSSSTQSSSSATPALPKPAIDSFSVLSTGSVIPSIPRVQISKGSSQIESAKQSVYPTLSNGTEFSLLDDDFSPGQPGACDAMPELDKCLENWTASKISLQLGFSSTTEPCHIPNGIVHTAFSVIYTTTITFFGRREDYTPPFPDVTTPHYCKLSYVHTKAMSGLVPPEEFRSWHNSGQDTRHVNVISSITFVTEDKNPAVVFSESVPPDYKPTWGTFDDSGNRHKVTNGPAHISVFNKLPYKPLRSLGYQVSARGNLVVIDGHSYSDLKPDETTTVTIGTAKFTIHPTAVEGQGGNVPKPLPAGTVVSIETPTSTSMGGLPVTITGSLAVVDGTTMKIPATATTASVGGQTVRVGPGTVIVGRQTFSFEPLLPGREIDVVVVGGDLVTGIGRSIFVVHSTTFTYGYGLTDVSKTMKDDTIYIGPSEVKIGDRRLGGNSADVSGTFFEIIGGLSVTKIAPSTVMVDGIMLTVGPGTQWTTTIISGNTFTVGPTGVIVSTVTVRYPFGSSVSTVIHPTGTWLSSDDDATKAAETGEEGKDKQKIEEEQDDQEEEDAGARLLQPGMCFGWLILCIAIGGWVLA